MTAVILPQPTPEDEAAMWCDLLLGRIEEDTARFHVTRRAELYMRVAGLPLARVLDALNIDESGWATQLAELRAQEERNRAANNQPVRLDGGGL
jgi:hypothetical protein